MASTASIVFQFIATLEGAAAILSEPLHAAIDTLRLPKADVLEHTLERLLADV